MSNEQRQEQDPREPPPHPHQEQLDPRQESQQKEVPTPLPPSAPEGDLPAANDDATENEETESAVDVGVRAKALEVQQRLLKYDEPLFVDHHDKKINWATKILTAGDMAPAITGTTKLLNSQLSDAEIQEFLSVIFPPLEWEEDGQLFRQKVSSTQATEQDLDELEKEIEQRLSLRHARTEGLSDSHREIFEDCFDEILRQVTIDNPERGFVLRRVRDELRMTFDVYSSLYNGSVAYSTRKSLLMQTTQAELDRIGDENDETIGELREQVQALQSECNKLQQEQDELEEADQKRRREEIDFYKEINAQLKAKLEKFISRIKKVSSENLSENEDESDEYFSG